jgi:hypothetical protein
MKREHQVGKVIVIGAALLLFPFSLRTHAASHEGEAWLEMNTDTRTGFVFGYTVGLSRGFVQGCLAYQKSVPPPEGFHPIADDPFLKCTRQGFSFTKPLSFYAEQITKFYTASAEDRKVPFQEVIKKLSDEEHLTPEQMHEYFKQHGYGKFHH